MTTYRGLGAASQGVALIDETVSVGEYGAVGDGVTDDTTAIQNCIDTEGDGAYILFNPNKTYLISDDIIPNDYQTLDLNGSTIKLKAGSTAAGGLIRIGHTSLGYARTNVTVKNGIIDGNGDNQTHYPFGGVKIDDSSIVWLENLYIINCIGDNVADGQIAGIWAYNSSEVMIDKCYIKDSNNNILIQGSRHCTISNSRIEGNTRSEGISFFKKSATAYGTCYNNTITNCTFKDNRQDIIVVGGKYTTISNCTSINPFDVALSVTNGPTSISNYQIELGADSDNYAISLGQSDQDETAGVVDMPYTLVNVSVNVNGQNQKAFHIADSSPNQITLVGCSAFNGGSAQTGDISAFDIQAGTNIKLIGCTASGFSGSGYKIQTSSKNVSLIDCDAHDNGRYGILVDANGCDFLRVQGGAYFNNSTSSADTYNGILINSTGNCNAEVSHETAFYDDQDTKTQPSTGISPSTVSAVEHFPVGSKHLEREVEYLSREEK